MTGRTIVVLGCGKAKRREVADVVTLDRGPVPSWREFPIVDLYVGNLYTARLAYAKQLGGPHWIVSGFHGIRRPDYVVGPYERDLASMRSDELRAWQGQQEFGALQIAEPGDRVVVLASAPYAGKWCAALARSGCTVDLPLAGMQIGEQLQWLKAQRSAAGT